MWLRALSPLLTRAILSRHHSGTSDASSCTFGRLGDQSSCAYQGSVSHHRSGDCASIAATPDSISAVARCLSVDTTRAFICSNFACVARRYVCQLASTGRNVLPRPNTPANVAGCGQLRRNAGHTLAKTAQVVCTSDAQ